MSYQFVPMNDGHAKAVAGWHHEGIYGFYDFKRDPEDLAELLDFHAREGRYYAVLNEENELAGFFRFEPRGDVMEIGPGLRPGDTGKRLGSTFVQAGMDFARSRFHPKQFRLQVAKFNQRAIRVYEKLGFRIE